MYDLVPLVAAVIVIIISCGIIILIIDHRIIIVHPPGPDPDPWPIVLSTIGVYIATFISLSSIAPAGNDLVLSSANVVLSAIVTGILTLAIGRTASTQRTIAK